MNTPTPTPTPAVPLDDDEPLDAIEWAFVRAMVSALLKEIREEEAVGPPADRRVG